MSTGSQFNSDAYSSQGIMKESNANKDGAIPSLVKLYLRLYKAIPTLHLPGTKLDIGFMTFWMIFFLIIRCMAVVPVFLIAGWPQDKVSTFDAAASFVGGYFHAPQIVPLTYVLIRTQKPYNPSAVAKNAPRWWQDATDAALQLCTAYMVYDFFFLVWTRRVPGQGIVLDSDAVLFMAHHFMTFFYMTTSRICGAGQSSALTCIFLGEFTNTPFNTYFIYDMAKRVGLTFSPFYAQFVKPVEVFTAALYLLLRAILCPLILSYVSYNLMVDKSIRAYVPLVLRLIWVALIFGVLLGSIDQNITFYNLLKDYMTYDITNEEL
jgi:hypothetical protein